MSDEKSPLDDWRKRAEQAEAALRTLFKVFIDADEERLVETELAHEEAAKWKAEGDMYGWNFHEGRAGGITWGSIIFHRVLREIEAIKKRLL